MLTFTAEEDDDLEHPTQEQEERRTTTIGFEFPRGLKNSATTFQAVVRQLATTDPIDSLTRPPIGIPLMTTRSSGLALSEIRTMKPEELAWGGSNQEAINSSRKYPVVNESTTIKYGSSSSSCTPPQPGPQHGPTAGSILWDRSGLPLPNLCSLSD
jgi:hypothetical protein